MLFNRSNIIIGDGRVSGAVEKNGEIHFFLDSEGMIVERTMAVGRRGVSREEFKSFADDYTETLNSSVALWGNEIEVK